MDASAHHLSDTGSGKSDSEISAIPPQADRASYRLRHIEQQLKDEQQQSEAAGGA